MYTVAIQTGFSAAHYHRGASRECGRVHGHNYRVEVIIEAEKLKDDMVMDFRELSESVRQVIKSWDHRLLNDLADFQALSPTTENIARLIFDKLQIRPGTDAPLLREVIVWEKEDSRASYKK